CARGTEYENDYGYFMGEGDFDYW
nr:immunoglobulin heavy chain junction region [Macaca mulatta]MOX95294.1 immunoglobulin heavy chain junction region [Macaca mulatta]